MTNVRFLAWDRDVPLEHPEPEGDQGADRQAARRGHRLGLERARHGYVFDVAKGKVIDFLLMVLAFAVHRWI